MSSFAKDAENIADAIATASYGIETIADLLGCDGQEHNLTTADVNGLHFAIKALGVLVKTLSLDLYERADLAQMRGAKQ